MMRLMTSKSMVLVGCVSVTCLALSGCGRVQAVTECDADRACTDPARPFCDLEGTYPASEGEAGACIPTPTTTLTVNLAGTGEGVVQEIGRAHV